MSMTKEEIIKKYERVVEGGELVAPFMGEDAKGVYEMLKAGLSALRPITREQVEKMRGKFFQAGIDDVAQDTWRCSRCLVQEFGNIQGINFCPSCGAPLTDKAVDRVMERLEELKDE